MIQMAIDKDLFVPCKPQQQRDVYYDRTRLQYVMPIVSFGGNIFW